MLDLQGDNQSLVGGEGANDSPEATAFSVKSANIRSKEEAKLRLVQVKTIQAGLYHVLVKVSNYNDLMGLIFHH